MANSVWKQLDVKIWFLLFKKKKEREHEKERKMLLFYQFKK